MMIGFIALSIVGGLLMIPLDSIYFLFAYPKLEKYQGGYLVAGAIWWFGGIIALVCIPLSTFCVHSILNLNDNDTVHLLSFIWILFLIPTRIYWVIKMRKKQKEIDKTKPPVEPGKIRWF
jgi:hypothetical protein